MVERIYIYIYIYIYQMPLSSQHQVPRRSSFAGKHEHAERWNDPPSAAAAMARVERKEDAEKRLKVTARTLSRDAAGRQVVPDNELSLLKAGAVGLRANVIHCDMEGAVQEMLPLRREAREAARRADTLRESVIKSKVALVKARVALEKKVAVSQGRSGGQNLGIGRENLEIVAVRAGGGSLGGGVTGEELLAAKDHLKFQMMLGKVGEVDEEVTALRREIVGSEREARALRVQVLKFILALLVQKYKY
jgi:hypothetical protein